MYKYILIKIMNKLMRKDGKSACENINSYFRKQGMLIGGGVESIRIFLHRSLI